MPRPCHRFCLWYLQIWMNSSHFPSTLRLLYPLGGSLPYLGFPHSSVGKESTCNARDPGLIPGQGRSAEDGIGYPLQYSWTSLVAQLVKNPPAYLGSIPELRRSPGEGKGYPLQYSGLEKSMDYIVQGVTKNQTQLSHFHFPYLPDKVTGKLRNYSFWRDQVERKDKCFIFVYKGIIYQLVGGHSIREKIVNQETVSSFQYVF